MAKLFTKRFVILFSTAWIAVVAGFLYVERTAPQLEAERQQEFERKLGECRGTFSERYECTSALLRKQSSDKATAWTLQLLLLFGPPLAAGSAYAVRRNLRERRHEEEAERARLERLHREAHEALPPLEDFPRREIDDIRKRADERRRMAKLDRRAAGQIREEEAGEPPPPKDHPPKGPASSH